jgi:LysR family transcriptional regulator, glycine cleavage system transcriptional activator
MSFKSAADELCVTATAISHQIRLLEAYCGQPLFRRHPRPLALTETGRNLFSVVREGLDAFSLALAGIGEGVDHRPLKVTATNAFACRWLVPRLPDWSGSHPGCGLEVIGTDDVLDLWSGEADVAIRYARTAPAELVVHELFRDRFYPICSPALLSDGVPILRPSDLLLYRLIHCGWPSWNTEAPTWRRWSLMARSVDPELPGLGEIGDLNFREELHAIEAVIAGQGISMLSDVVVARELESGLLVKALDLAIPGLAFYLVHIPGHPRQAMIDAFLSWMSTGHQDQLPGPPTPNARARGRSEQPPSRRSRSGVKRLTSGTAR